MDHMISVVPILSISFENLQLLDHVHWLAIIVVDGRSIQQLAVYLVSVIMQSDNYRIGAHDGLHIFGLLHLVCVWSLNGIIVMISDTVSFLFTYL